MAALTDPIRVFIVQNLACFDAPQRIVEKVKEEFEVTVARSQVQQYDPERASAKTKGLSKRWRVLFAETRALFIKEIGTIPVAQQARRLRLLQDAAEQAVARRQTGMLLQILEQAAKETGGAYTNRRELSGPAGGPIPLKGDVLHTLTDADLERIASSARSGG